MKIKFEEAIKIAGKEYIQKFLRQEHKEATFVVWVDWSCRKKDENLINSNCLNKRFLYDAVLFPADLFISLVYRKIE